MQINTNSFYKMKHGSSSQPITNKIVNVVFTDNTDQEGFPIYGEVYIIDDNDDTKYTLPMYWDKNGKCRTKSSAMALQEISEEEWNQCKEAWNKCSFPLTSY